MYGFYNDKMLLLTLCLIPLNLPLLDLSVTCHFVDVIFNFLNSFHKAFIKKNIIFERYVKTF